MTLNKAFSTFAVLIMAAFMITGCTSDGNTQISSKEKTFIGGTDGLLISFEDGAPPEEVFDGSSYPFDIVIQLENKGETKVAKEDVTVKITGINPIEFGKSNNDLSKHPNDVLERTYLDPEGNTIEGTMTTVEFTDLEYKNDLAGNQKFPIRAEVCYKYQTIAATKICITNDPRDVDDDEVCKVSEAKPIESSSAPVQVTRFEETARSATKVAFTFDVELVYKNGDNNLFRKNSKCDDTDRDNEDRVFLSVDSGNLQSGLTCTGIEGTTGEIKLYKGSKTITCTQELVNPGEYEQQVKITLDYDYRDFKQTEILVKHEANE